MNRRSKKAITFLLSVVATLYLSKEFLNAFDCGFPPRETKEGGQIAGTLSRHQQVYWFTHQKFATIKELVAEGFTVGQENYKYSMEVAKDAVFTQSFTTITDTVGEFKNTLIRRSLVFDLPFFQNEKYEF